MRSPGARYRKPVGQLSKQVADVDPLVEATLEEVVAWVRQAHQGTHEATRLLTEALNTGQLSITESARQELVRACTAVAQALAHMP